MKYDMLIHCGSAKEIEQILKNDFVLVANLCFSAWAEVNSNSLMFGGKDSLSLKLNIKNFYKELIKF